MAAELSMRHTAAALAVESLALELLVVAARAHAIGEGPRAPAWLTRIRDRLHDEFRNAPDLQTLAAGAGVHPAHLTRTFRRHFGQSVGSYLRQVRLDWAAHRLATSDDLLVDVAAHAGFADQSHFTRQFRQQIGCTPARYRHRVRAGGPG
jgi:AraC family transcriptional regulator